MLLNCTEDDVRPGCKRKASESPSSKAQQKRADSIDVVKILEQQALHVAPRRCKPRLLQAFPSFDKCDSLLFFAHSFTRYINSGDFQGMYKFISSHVDKQYLLNLYHGNVAVPLTCRGFARFFEQMSDFQPDRIMCVTSTKVVDNQIQSTIMMKFTDLKIAHDNVAAATQEPVFRSMWGSKRSDSLKEKVNMLTLPSDVRNGYHALIDREIDLEINVRIDFALTFHEVTKKVTKLDFRGRMVSMKPSTLLQ
jgi:hypothetical protein